MNIKQLILIILLSAYLPCAFSIDSLSISAASIKANGWHLSNTTLTLSELSRPTAKVSLSAKKLNLPAPLNNIRLLNIRCQQFSWHDNYLNCQQGKLQLQTALFKKQSAIFSLRVKNQQAQLTLNDLALFGGTISLSAQEKNGNWVAELKATQINLEKIKAFLKQKKLESLSGNANIAINLQGNMTRIDQLLINALTTQLSVQDTQGKLATEDVNLKSTLSLKKQKNGWQWQSTQIIDTGAIYAEPVYLEITKDQPIHLSANGQLLAQQQKIKLHSAKLIHSGVAMIQAQATISYQQNLQIQTAEIHAKLSNLEHFSAIYLAPFIAESALEGFNLQGDLTSNVTINNNTVSYLTAHLNAITINDTKHRFQANTLKGTVFWSPFIDQQKTSTLEWDSLKVKEIPFDAGSLNFSITEKHIKLLDSPNIVLLDGLLAIEQFEFNSTPDMGTSVKLRARISDISLTKLSNAMHWENTLSGTMSGYIPSVTYKDDTLNLNGSLKMQLFDGEVTINKLASAGMFSDFARLHTDIEFKNLDLNEVTKQFKVGNIQGRISGFMQNVYLENWQPVSFFAWLGTPENDQSTHKISHKAVRNIASLGGANAADIISRGVLSWFDDFGYEKLALGCYLYNGVCQMMGASAAEKGYYLIKGRGIPRIDIIGFNTKVDWNTLVKRLKRITTPTDITIEPLH